MGINTNKGRKNSALKLMALTSTALVGLTLSPTAAAQSTWQGGVSESWFDGGNWQPSGVPTAGDDVTINNGPNGLTKLEGVGFDGVAKDITVSSGNDAGSTLLVFRGATLTANSITLGDATGNKGSLEIGGDNAVSAAASFVTTTGAVVVGKGGQGNLSIGKGTLTSASGTLGANAGSTAFASVNGTFAHWDIGGSLIVGDAGAGTLNILNGGTVAGSSASIGDLAGSTGLVVVNGSAATWTSVGSLTVGNFGDGALSVLNGATVNSATGTLGQAVGSTGTATVDGTGSVWNAGSFLTVGNNGTGNLTISNGGKVVDVEGAVGIFSNGTVNVTGVNSEWTNTGDLTVGYFSFAGALNVSGGAEVNSASSYIGRDAGVSGVVNVSGANSTWTSTGSLAVGNSGSGTLSIFNGAIVNSATGTLGQTGGSSGIATVDGIGSAWNAGSFLSVGNNGTGKLTISNGGEVINVEGAIGLFANGTVDVAGAGSNWTNTGDLTVGYFSFTGVLNIANGASVSSATSYIGRGPSGFGIATVDGVGSNWTSSDVLFVGDSGDGTVNITNGGTVTSSLGFLAASSATAKGTVTVDGAGSTWTNDGATIVGVNGAGKLNVFNGAKVLTGANSVANGVLGSSAGSQGIGFVDGAGSEWDVSGDLIVGGSGSATLAVVSGGTLTVNGDLIVAQNAGSAGAIFIGANVAPGTINATSLQFGAGNGRITFHHTDSNYFFATPMSGNGKIIQDAGVTHLTGNSGGFTGFTFANGGSLFLDGQLGGSVSVNDGGTFGGIGNLTGIATVFSGGRLIGEQGQTLTMGTLDLESGSFVNATFSTPGGAALFNVTNSLTLDGTLNITAADPFGPGVYKLFTYGGALTDNGLDIGNTPDGSTGTDFLIQTSVAGQVNLVNNSLPNMLFWDGDAAGSANNNAVDGGSGVWSNASTNWTDANGSANGVMHPQPGFAIFEDPAGIVTVDGSAGDVAVTGMQFASNGYLVTGAPITLTKANSSIRVGDGSAAGADFVAIIDSKLTGAGGLDKTDLGTLILTGDNNYAGGTKISGGTLQLGAGGTTGSIIGNVQDNGTLIFNRSDAVFFAGQISGTGLLIQAGTGKTNLTDDSNAYAGGVRVDGGTLAIIAGGQLGASSVFVATDSGSNAALTVVGAGSSLNSVGGLVVGAHGAGSLTVGDGAALNLGDTYLGLLGGGTGTALIDGAGTTITTKDVYLGGGGSGIATISGGAAVFSKMAYLGFDGSADGSVTVTGPGSSWTADSIGVGVHGTGTLNILKGGVVTDGTVNGGAALGAAANSQGFANVNGPGSAWINNGAFYVGAAGTGDLSVANAGKVTSTDGYIGFSAGSSGSVAIDGIGSSWINSGLLAIGNDGAGKLAVTNGAVVTADRTYLGFGSGSNGTASVDGKGSSLSGTQGIVVGVDGSGSLSITKGGVVTGDQAVLGDNGASVGSVSVDGVGSKWTNAGQMIVGYAGTGNLSVTNGASVSNTNALIGFQAGSKGDVLVAGAGSTWTSNDLAIGGIGQGTLTITDGGAVKNDNAAVASLAGVNSAVIVDGAGSSWTSNGQVIVGQFGNGIMRISNGATVAASGPMTLASAAGSIGLLNIGGLGGSAPMAAGTLNVASLQFGNGNGILNFNHTSTNYAFATSMAGTGTINQLAGVTNLTGNSGNFFGAVNVVGGKLSVNGSLANGIVTVGTGATLGGNGAIGGLITQSGSIIAPGNSIGTLNVLGNASFAAGSIYQVELNGAGQSDLIKATGTASIANGALITVTKTDAAPYLLGTRYTVLTADGGVTGKFTFGNVQLTNFLGLVSGSDAESFFFDVAKTKSFASAGKTPNQSATATAIDGMPINSGVTGAIASLMSDASAQAAFDQLSGEIHASAKKVLIEDSRFVRDAALDRLRTSFDGMNGETTTTYVDGKLAVTDATTARFAVWGKGYGAWGRRSSDGNAATIKSDVGGMLIGADALAGENVRIGVIGGYSRSTFRIPARNSSGTSDNYDAGIYAGGKWGNISARAGAAYTWHTLETDRSPSFTGFSDRLVSKYGAGTAQVFGEFGYGIKAGKATFEPFANLTYVDLTTNGFAEKGGAAALKGKKDDTGVTYTTIGTRASTTLSLGNGGTVTARGTAGWRHAFDTSTNSTLTLTGSAPFSISGVPIAKDGGVVDLGLDMNVAKNTTIGVSYGGQFGSGATDQTVRASISFRF